ncbi:MAG: tetratricopeptide repeat protein [Longimicrobiales bacterium]|nr:tetratricopeptide repeat protein [Longimicrobiales bacterium]
MVTETSGPEDPSGSRHPKLTGAGALLRRGMVALDKSKPRRLDEAEVCFRQALDLLEEVLDEPHPRISYALDRIGLVCHLRGDVEEAESLYLRSLAVLGDVRSPTKWNDITILNLAILYGRQGRTEERDAVMRLYEP